MKSWFARISYKMLVTMMITIVLSFFVVTSCSHANRFSDLVNDDGIYYTGTQDAKLVVHNSIFSQIVNALSQIANYLLGLMTLGIRGVFIGWFEIAERLLTSILDIEGDLGSINTNAMDNHVKNTINVESILFNRVALLNANLFEVISDEEENVADETEDGEEETRRERSATIVESIKLAVAKWYYVLRLLTIAFMLVLLIFVGVKMAISTIASEKAVYKQMLVDWVAGMIIVFTIHYMMIGIFTITDTIIEGLEPLINDKSEIKLEEYEYGIEKDDTTYDELETTLYESARTRAYSLKLTDGFTGMVIYGVLVYYAWRFAIMYFIRMFNLMILTLIAPVIAASYAANKVISGKSKIFSGWLLEYVINVIIRLFHVIIYVSFVAIALKLSMESLLGTIIAFSLLRFMLEADKMLRALFKMSGGKGSLAGNMDAIGFKEVKSGMKNLRTAMVGGKFGKDAMSAVYRVATKPARLAAEVAFGNHMAKKANEEEEEKRKRVEEKQELEKKRNELEEEIANLKVKEQLEELEKQHKKWSEEQNASYADRDKEGEEIATKELEKLEAQMKPLQSKRDALEDIQDELEYMNESEKIENLTNLFMEGTLKGTLLNVVDAKQYVKKGEDGRYHRMKAIRKGGANKAFWREKKDSIGKQFMDNVKLSNLLNLSKDEVKELKKQYNFTKSTVLGFASAIMGFPAFVVNPVLGIGLLGQATYSGLGVATKIRQIKNRPSYKKSKTYNFSSFNKTAQYTIQVEAVRQMKEVERERVEKIAGKHQTFVKNLFKNTVKATTIPDFDPIATERLSELSYAKFTKQFKTALKSLNQLETSMDVSEFKRKFSQEEQRQKEAVEKISTQKLLFNELAGADNVVAVGDSLFEIDWGSDSEKAENKFIYNVEKYMENRTDKTRGQKIASLKYRMKDNKEELIQNQIEKYFARRGVVDISNVAMSETDKTQIKENILGVLEEKGIIKKGEIKLEDNVITTEDVETTYAGLQDKKDKTNQSLERRIATDAVLEYITKTGITEKDALQQKTDEIYNMVKEKMMSEASKQSADVIKMLSGEDKKKEEINLSDFMKNVVEEDIQKVKKVNYLVNPKDRSKLVEHETNRRMTETKKQLEEAIYADTTENIEDEKKLELLFLLSKIGNHNEEAVRVLGLKQKEKKKEQLEKLNFYQDGSRRIDKNKDGSRRFDQTRDGSQKVVEQLFMESKKQALEKRIFGPSQNVIDLINHA